MSAAIWADVLRAASAAATAANDALPPEGSRGLDCGFAWIVIKPARGAFVTWAKEQKLGETRDYGGGGFQIWYSKFDPTPTQSISVHEAAAMAACNVLQKHGIPATWNSRLD